MPLKAPRLTVSGSGAVEGFLERGIPLILVYAWLLEFSRSFKKVFCGRWFYRLLLRLRLDLQEWFPAFGFIDGARGMAVF